jgi:hypothetical protein
MGIVAILVALLTLSLLCHGFWLLVGWFFRTLFGRKALQPVAVPCPGCGRPMPPAQIHCDTCGLDRSSAAAVELADLRAMARQLRRFHDAGVLTDEVFGELLSTLAEQRQRLTQPKAPPERVAPAVPAAIPVYLHPDIREKVSASAAETSPPIVESEQPPVQEPAPVIAVAAPASPEPIPVLAAAAIPTAALTPVQTAEAPPAPAPPPSRPPRRSFVELLAAFMEQRNILWGELLGGLLIVGGSTMLALYLWKTHEGNPLYQCGIFVAVTTALFAAGLYTLSHWKLETTSRGLLAIATLLVPLDFLAIAAQAKGGGDLVEILIEIGYLAIFSVLFRPVARVLAPDGGWLFTLAVLGTAATELLVPRLLGQDHTYPWLWFTFLGFLPVACYETGIGGTLVRVRRRGPVHPDQANALFLLMGIAFFALAIALGLLVFWSVGQGSDPATARSHLAMLVVCAGLPLVAGGSLIRRRLADEGPVGAYRTAGTAVTLSGMLVMVAAVALGWPHPVPLLVVCALDFVFLTALAFRYDRPALHGLALPCLAVGWLTAYHLLNGHLEWDHLASSMAEWGASASSGIALAGLILPLAAAAEGLVRWHRRSHGIYYIGAAGLGALLSLALVTLPTRGISHPFAPMVLYGLYGAVALVVNGRWRQPIVSSLGLALLVAATMWGLWWPFSPVGWLTAGGVPPYWGAVLAAEALLMGVAAVRLGRGGDLAAVYRDPLARSAEAVTPLALLASLWSFVYLGEWSLALVVTAGCLFALYLLLATAERQVMPARVSGLMLIGMAATLAGWAGTLAGVVDLPGWIHLAIAAAGVVLAGVAICRGPISVLAGPWREIAIVAGVLALGLTGWSFALPSSGLPAWTLGLVAATAFLLAWGYGVVPLAWVGSLLILGAVVDVLARLAPNLAFPTPFWDMALLSHGTLVFLAGLVLERYSDRVRCLFADPLRQSGLLASLAALPLLVMARWGHLQIPALGLAWLAVLWVLAAWVYRWPLLFTTAQAVLALGVLFGVSVWLEGQTWFVPLPSALWDPRSLHAYGGGLLGFCLLWTVIRHLLRSSQTGRALLEPTWLALDHVVLSGLLVGQVALAIWGLLPFLTQELSGVITSWPTPAWDHTADPSAWLLCGATAVVLILVLARRRAGIALVGLAALALTIPYLTAGRFAADQAAIGALGWTLGAAFLALSIPLWLPGRPPQANGLRAQRLDLARMTRAILVAGAVLPVLLLTMLDAAIRFDGQLPITPTAATFFGRIHWLVVLIVPLAMISLGLFGHGLRLRSAGYTFSAGLVINLSVTGGYALAHLSALDMRLYVQLGQIASLVAAVWALAWLFLRDWILARGSPAQTPPVPLLLRIQIGMGVVGNAVIIGGAVALLAILAPMPMAWVEKAGMPLGWTALLTAFAAVIVGRFPERRFMQPWAVGWFGLASLGLVACTVERIFPEHAYRTLMLGWAAYPLVWVLASWRLMAGRADTDETAATWELLPVAAHWVRLAGLLAVGLSFKAAVVHSDHLAAALALTLVSPAAAVMGVWRRREDWAFIAGLGVNLAASLVVWHYHSRLAVPWPDWWVYLVQANLIAGAAVALLWLGLRERLYGRRELTIRAGPLLAFQVGALVVVNVALLLLPCLLLAADPNDSLPGPVLAIGGAGGRLALLLTVAAAGWYVGQIAPRQLVHVLGGLGIGLGVLAACSMAHSDAPNWTAFHVLTAAWIVAALLLLVAIWVVQALGRLEVLESVAGEGEAVGVGMTGIRSWLYPAFLETPFVEAWAVFLGALVQLLAWRATWQDPAIPYGSAGPSLAVAVLAGVLAVWRRQVVLCPPALYVYVSGLLVNAAGAMAWVAWGERDWLHFSYVQVLCLGLGGAFWSALELALPGRTREPRGKWVPFPHLAATVGLILATAVIGEGVRTALAGGVVGPQSVLPWASWCAMTAAVVLLLWDSDARAALSGVYVAGLLGIFLALTLMQLQPRDFGWTTAPLLALYALLTAALFGTAPRLTSLWRSLRLPGLPADTAAWFIPLQGWIGCVSLALSVWMTLDFDSAPSRLGGPLSAALLLPAGVLMAGRAGDRAKMLQMATLSLGVFAAIETGWALLDPAGHHPAWLWLHRNVIVLVVLAMMTGIYGVVLARRLPAATGWANCARRIGPVLGLLAVVVLAGVLLQEAWFYEGHKTVVTLVADLLKLSPPASLQAGPRPADVHMAPLAVGVVAAALVALMAACLAFAVIPGRDPLGLSERGRTLYVYAAEVLLVLMFVHIRLTLPFLFQLGLFARYWPFILMAIAFAGAGLSEFFRRRQIAVLAEPLQRTGVFLPLLPVLAFWVSPPGSYATIWFLAGLLYGLLSVARHSFRFALLAALCANMGLWVLLHLNQLLFLEHPQLWLIPLALIALVSEQVNRDRLTPLQSANLRYFALIVIYLSSTADMFLAGLGQSVVLPLVLAGLSVLGVLAGMLLRVRAFLFLGATFLLFDILTLIWHAGIDLQHTWILWAAVIVLGVILVAMFGVFEKRRNDVLRMLENLKQWD